MNIAIVYFWPLSPHTQNNYTLSDFTAALCTQGYACLPSEPGHFYSGCSCHTTVYREANKTSLIRGVRRTDRAVAQPALDRELVVGTRNAPLLVRLLGGSIGDSLRCIRQHEGVVQVNVLALKILAQGLKDLIVLQAPLPVTKVLLRPHPRLTRLRSQ